MKNVPGRKTDVSDAAWLAELLAHGLIRASFVPDGQTQELRDLLRTRKQLVREGFRNRNVNHFRLAGSIKHRFAVGFDQPIVHVGVHASPNRKCKSILAAVDCR